MKAGLRARGRSKVEHQQGCKITTPVDDYNGVCTL